MAAEILQLTDLHLMADRRTELKGVRTRDTFAQVMRFVREQTDAGSWDFNYILVTGDMAHDEQQDTYELLREMLGDWVSRCRLIPGNHDSRDAIRTVFPEIMSTNMEFINFSFDVACWRMIGLDSHVDGEVHGQLGRPQLDWLAAELKDYADQPTLLFLHHPPIPVHSAWLDRIGLADAAAFMEVVRASPQIRAVCAGHVHQEFERTFDDVQFLTTPSTGVQFLPQQDEIRLDSKPPGFRTFRIGDGMESTVVRLPETNTVD